MDLIENKIKVEEIRKKMKLQREIESIADVNYDCYVNMMSESEFWKRWLG